MAFSIKHLPLLLALSCVVAQFDEYQPSYEGYEHLHQEPIHHQSLDGHHHDFDTDYHAHPKYQFDYSVKDPHTGDDKEHWETRDGDKVKGTYTIMENDGTKRVVEYEADDKNGFNAVVHKIGTPKEENYHHIPHHHHHEPHHEPIHHHEPHHVHHEPHLHHESHEFQGFDDGFVPIVGGYHH